MAGLIRIFRRWRLSKRPFPVEWLSILERRVPFFRRINGESRGRFLKMLKVFVWEKYFIGAGGMRITDEVRVVISACAVRLIVHLGLSYYDRLTEIVVYPYIYVHDDEEVPMLGEAQDWGTVVLSWPAVLHGLENQGDGHETAIHEFAHVLDRGGGAFDGTPQLKTRADYHVWAEIMSHHFLRLRASDPIEQKVLRMYGAVNEAEFFAVATEAYFEKPRLMRELTPDLYAELQSFYGGDPAEDSDAG